MDIKLKEYLERNGIKYKEFQHPAIFTVAESAKIKDKIPGMHCKCLFLEDNLERFYLVGMPAEKRLNIKKLEKYFEVKKIRFGSEEELKEKLHLAPGSVSIFGMINTEGRVLLIFDKEVWDANYIGFHPNINTSTIVIDHANLIKFVDSLKTKHEVIEL